MADRYRVGVVGARGYTGGELLRLIGDHPHLELAFAGSRELEGRPIPGFDGLRFESISPSHLADRPLVAVFLALPDGAAAPYVEATPEETVIVDISADHRFQADWVYGLPELFRDRVRGATRIANPGCYATAAQLALAPLLDLVSGVPAVFGVSGYSGAGSTPGPRNDPDRLADSLLPYALSGHKHERESSLHLGIPIRIMPHVHPAYRGLLVTAHIPLAEPLSRDRIEARFTDRYRDEPLVEVQGEPPALKDGAGRLGVLIGGIATSGDDLNAVVVAAEDNLLKGAAVQAVQNLNLALGLPELAGIL